MYWYLEGNEMDLLGFVILFVIAAIAGAIGQSLAGYSLGGCLVSGIVGFIGAFLGMWLANTFGLPELLTINVQGQPFPIVWSVIGSFLFTLVVGVITRGARRSAY
jgi:uncharacterized membrane protein YeaQ/YmgE (transglycosylase-associated protein family)